MSDEQSTALNVLMDAATAIDEITDLCQRYAHPGCEPGTHALASKILAILERHGLGERKAGA